MATRRSVDAASSALERLASEPVAGMYHVREHVSRSVPRLVSLSAGLERASASAAQTADDASFYAERAQSLSAAVPSTADSIERSLTRAFKAVDAIRQQKRAGTAGANRRFSFSPGGTSSSTSSPSSSPSLSSSPGGVTPAPEARRRTSLLGAHPPSPAAYSHGAIGERGTESRDTPTSKLKEGS